MDTQTVEIEFVHHHQERNDGDVVDFRPGDRASFPARKADALVRDKLAVIATDEVVVAPEPSTKKTPPAAAPEPSADAAG